ncbi:hypothetical protein BH23GEM3_BH23GEM3_03430 [soil metagenome]|nr:hypothetical protein [Gemmatimonadota bacterium]
MIYEPETRERDLEAEWREQRRYALLERLYLLTGDDCSAVVYDRQMEAELGVPGEEAASLTDELIQLRYLAHIGEGQQVCITEKGLAFLQKGAWRRRSIRE